VKICLEAVEWAHTSDDGLGPVEVTLTVDRDAFRAFQDLLRGVHRRWAGSTVEISQPVILRIKGRL
jgi:hypothetical protein